jgi:ribosomal protein S18 acetylase RimI-like enzyme
MRIVIRQAEDNDAVGVTAVIHAAFEPYRGRLVPDSSAHAETVDTVRGKMANGGAVLAEQDGRLVAATLFEREGDALYIGRLAVLPEARRNGLAPRLVEAVEAIARERGIRRLTLGVRLALDDNIRLFTRLGFRETGRTSHPGFTEHTSMDMEKRL